MKPICCIAWNTVKEFLANKIIYLLVALTLLVFEHNARGFAEAMNDANVNAAGMRALFLSQVKTLTFSLSFWMDFTIIGMVVFASGMGGQRDQTKDHAGDYSQTREPVAIFAG